MTHKNPISMDFLYFIGPFLIAKEQVFHFRRLDLLCSTYYLLQIGNFSAYFYISTFCCHHLIPYIT